MLTIKPLLFSQQAINNDEDRRLVDCCEDTLLVGVFQNADLLVYQLFGDGQWLSIILNAPIPIPRLVVEMDKSKKNIRIYQGMSDFT